MQVLYIDVYFLINLTVDLLALFLAMRLTSAVVSPPRLLACSVLGAICSVFDILMPNMVLLRVANICAFLLLLGRFAIKRGSVMRRLRLTIMFFIIEALLGGLVHFVYTMLDRAMAGIKTDGIGGASNRGALVFAVIILICVGVLRLVIMLFSRSGGVKRAKVRIIFDGKEHEAEAFVDSGNLVRDPMGMCPVVFIKSKLAQAIVPGVATELCEIGGLDERIKRRVRFIPITRGGGTHVLVGLRADSFLVCCGGWQEVDVTLAIDNEGGNYDGLDILIPSVVVDNA